jgi:hypothetical protein
MLFMEFFLLLLLIIGLRCSIQVGKTVQAGGPGFDPMQ